MASIADLCWNATEDLFRETDLDILYRRQLRTIGAEDSPDYPHMILIHTGKIVIGINLGGGSDVAGWGGMPGPGPVIDRARYLVSRSGEESSE